MLKQILPSQPNREGLWWARIGTRWVACVVYEGGGQLYVEGPDALGKRNQAVECFECEGWGERIPSPDEMAPALRQAIDQCREALDMPAVYRGEPNYTDAEVVLALLREARWQK